MALVHLTPESVDQNTPSRPEPAVPTTIVVASPVGKTIDWTPPWSSRWACGVASATPSWDQLPPPEPMKSPALVAR